MPLHGTRGFTQGPSPHSTTCHIPGPPTAWSVSPRVDLLDHDHVLCLVKPGSWAAETPLPRSICPTSLQSWLTCPLLVGASLPPPCFLPSHQRLPSRVPVHVVPQPPCPGPRVVSLLGPTAYSLRTSTTRDSPKLSLILLPTSPCLQTQVGALPSLLGLTALRPSQTVYLLVAPLHILTVPSCYDKM